MDKKHDLPAWTIAAVEDALVADRQELGRMLVRSVFDQEAVNRRGPRMPAGGWAATCRRRRRSSATDRPRSRPSQQGHPNQQLRGSFRTATGSIRFT